MEQQLLPPPPSSGSAAARSQQQQQQVVQQQLQHDAVHAVHAVLRGDAAGRLPLHLAAAGGHLSAAAALAAAVTAAGVGDAMLTVWSNSAMALAIGQ